MTTTPAATTPPSATSVPLSARRRRFGWAWIFAALAALPGAGILTASIIDVPLALAGTIEWPWGITPVFAFLGMLIWWFVGAFGVVSAILGIVGRRWALAIVSVLAVAGCVGTFLLGSWMFP